MRPIDRPAGETSEASVIWRASWRRGTRARRFEPRERRFEPTDRRSESSDHRPEPDSHSTSDDARPTPFESHFAHLADREMSDDVPVTLVVPASPMQSPPPVPRFARSKLQTGPENCPVT